MPDHCQYLRYMTFLVIQNAYTPPWTTGILIPSLRVRAVLKGILSLSVFAIWFEQKCTSARDHILYACG